ncbi:type 4b pilus protein PilO2 [Cupriavidus basilensis]
MQIVKLDKRRALAFGMSWATTDALSRGEQLRRARRDGSRVMASFSGVKGAKGARSGDDNFGHAKAFKAPKGVKAYSAAGQLGVHPKWSGATVLVVLEEDGGAHANSMTALVGLLRGNVILDAVTTPADAGRLIDNYRQRCMQANAEYILIGKAKITEGLRERFDWNDFIPPSTSRFKSAATVPVRPLNPNSTWVLAAAGALLCVTGGVAYYTWQDHLEEEQRLQEKRAREQEDPAFLYRRSATVLLAVPYLRANSEVSAVRTAIKDIPVLVAGWQLKDIDCTAAGCRATWSRKDGTYAEFDAHALPEWQPLTLSEDLRTITHALPVKLHPVPLPKRGDWPTSRAFLKAEASRWQRLIDPSIGLNISLAAPQVMAIPPGKEAKQFANVPDLIYGAKWEVKDSPWWTSDLFDKAPDNMTIEAIKVAFDGKQMKYTTNGIAYVQK